MTPIKGKKNRCNENYPHACSHQMDIAKTKYLIQKKGAHFNCEGVCRCRRFFQI